VFYLAVAAVYFIITLVSNGAFRLFERRINRWMPQH
jgi:polar amino acid transport system permease protein